MRFTTIPKSYSSFHSPIVYGFTTQSDTPRDVEVRIIDKSTDNVIGRKRLYNICEGEIDIAPYLRTSALNTLPDSIDGCGVVDLGQQMRVVVEADGVSAAVRNFVATQADLSEPFTSLMEQHPQRTMDRNEFDIISFFSLPDVVVEVEVEFIGYGTERISITPPSGGQRAVAITARGREGVDQIRVRVKADGEVVSVVEYQIRENLIGSRRLAWINSHRGIELYTFPLRKSILVEATRKHIETLWGREAADRIVREAERHFSGNPGQVMFVVRESDEADNSRFIPVSSSNEGDWSKLHDQATSDIVIAHSWFRSLSGLDYSAGFSAERILHEYEVALNTVILAEQEELLTPVKSVLRDIVGVDGSSLEIVNRPPTRSKPIYMKVWEARKADGLDYNPDDEREQQYLSEITKYNVTKIN